MIVSKFLNTCGFVPVFESASATQTFIEKLNVGSTKPYIELYAVDDTQIRWLKAGLAILTW